MTDERLILNAPLVRLLMRSRAWSQREFAVHLGVDAGNLSRALAGTTSPSLSMVDAIMRTFPAFAYDELVVRQGATFDPASVGARDIPPADAEPPNDVIPADGSTNSGD